MNTKQIVAALKKARELITPARKWCKGHFRIKTGETMSFCAVGAIRQVTRNPAPVVQKLAEFLPGRSGYGAEGDITIYNDADDTRKVQVLRLFDRAIKGLSTGSGAGLGK